MSAVVKAKNAVEDTGGKAKEALGKATGDKATARATKAKLTSRTPARK